MRALGIAAVVAGALIAVARPARAELIVVVVDHEAGVQPLVPSLDGDGELQAEMLPIYDAVMKSQWPMVTAQSVWPFADTCDGLRVGHEPIEACAIRNRLHEVDGRLDVVYVPTSLYEIYAWNWLAAASADPLVRSYYKGHVAEKLWAWWPKFWGSLNSNLMSAWNGTWSRSDYLSLYTDLHAGLVNPAVAKSYFALNQQLAQDLLARANQPMATAAALDDWLADPATIADLAAKPLTLPPAKPRLTRDVPATLLSAPTVAAYARAEVTAWRAGQALLYRGSKGFGSFDGARALDSPWKELEAGTLSYGNSLFAGVIADYGATAATYLGNPDTFGYLVPLDKHAYFTTLRRYFFVSPLSTLVAMAEHGELFHSRGLVGRDQLPIISRMTLEDGSQPSGGQRDTMPDDVLVARGFDWRCHAAAVTSYLATHARIVSCAGDAATPVVNPSDQRSAGERCTDAATATLKATASRAARERACAFAGKSIDCADTPVDPGLCSQPGVGLDPALRW